MRVRFYPVDERLEIADEAWLAEVQAGEMVVFIDYFGFNQWSACGAEVRERGGWVVEDASQALLNARFCEYAHYVVFSPRKFVGVPDGGILLAQRDAKLPEVSFPSPPSQWWLDAARASILRAEFDRHGGERTWFQFFQKTDLLGPLEPCRMSDLAFLILKNCINWQVVAQARRRNYQFLASELEDIAILPHLSDGVAPLGFSVRLKDRDRVRGGLFAAQIYPPVHWPIAGVVPPEFDASHRLAAEIMTIPCDQRYDIPDMKRVVNELRRSIAC
jgi:dTDP-4-amino-4,6-dideoxygalactose transaminase